MLQSKDKGSEEEREREVHTAGLKVFTEKENSLNFVAIFSSCFCINDVHVIFPFITRFFCLRLSVSLLHPLSLALSLKRALAIYYFYVHQSILCIILFIDVIRILMRQ